jgi:hypothetical protein
MHREVLGSSTGASISLLRAGVVKRQKEVEELAEEIVLGSATPVLFD